MRKMAYLLFVIALYSFLTIHILSPAAFAVSYSLEATSLAPWEWTDFSVIWTDDNQDGLFQLGEEDSNGFSGVTYLPFAMFYDRIEEVPGWSTQSPYTGGTAAEWYFSGPMGSMGADPSLWSYTRTEVAPIPASVLLLGSGFLGLGLLGWRRKST